MGYCATLIESRPESEGGRICQDAIDAIDAMGRIAERMKADLEEVRPWSPEVADLAGSTTANLDAVAAAAADKTGQRGARATKAAVELKDDLNAWSAYLK